MTKYRLKCWWYGCSEHPLDPAPVEEICCQWCNQRLSYEDMIGITGVYYIAKHKVVDLYRLVVPAKCIDCGKRFGHHDNCLPF